MRQLPDRSDVAARLVARRIGGLRASAASGGQQAGYAYMGAEYRASLWGGTAASWVDLNPAGAMDSYVYAISGRRQVGEARVGGVLRASLWSGTADSWVDLHAFVPAQFTSSQARAISSDGVNLYVAGYGVNGGFRNEALLWTRPLPCPAPRTCTGSRRSRCWRC